MASWAMENPCLLPGAGGGGRGLGGREQGGGGGGGGGGRWRLKLGLSLKNNAQTPPSRQHHTGVHNTYTHICMRARRALVHRSLLTLKL